MLAVLVENLLDRKFFLGALTALMIFFCFYDFSVMLDWRETGRRTDEALTSIKNQGENISSDAVYFWGVPDKFKRVPMMKLGIHQSVEWALGKPVGTGIEVNSPLRSELTGSESKIIIKEKSDSLLLFVLYGGRFLPEGGVSKSVIKDEKIFYKAAGIEIEIHTRIDLAAQPVSYASVRLPQNLKGDHLYFDGRKFIFIDDRE